MILPVMFTSFVLHCLIFRSCVSFNQVILGRRQLFKLRNYKCDLFHAQSSLSAIEIPFTLLDRQKGRICGLDVIGLVGKGIMRIDASLLRV